VRCFGDDKDGIVAAAPTLPAHWQVELLRVKARGACCLHTVAQVESISVGDQHACLIARDTSVKTAGASVTAGNNTRSSVGGNVTCWGDDKFGRCSPPCLPV
jgi:hypothetical protein